MNVAVVASFGQRVLSSGWSRKTAVALLGEGDFDLTGVVSGDNRPTDGFDKPRRP